MMRLTDLRRPDTLTVVYAVTVARSAYGLLRGQLSAVQERGYRVVLICSPDEDLVAFAAEQGVEVVPVAMTRGFASVADLRAIGTVVRVLFRLRPVLVNVSTPKASLVVGVAAWLTRVPVRIYSLWGLRLEGERAGSVRYRLLRAAERATCATATVVLCASEGLRDRAVSIGLVRAARTRVLGRGSTNGLDLERFRPSTVDFAQTARAPAELGADTVVIGFAGRIVADKGIGVLLDAFDAVARRLDAHLLLVGEFDSADPLPTGVRDRIHADQRITVTGIVDPALWYPVMDLFVLPSRREGLPNVLLEAAATGLPTITTRATGCPDAVEDQCSGLVVDVEDTEALIGAILALAADERTRRRMGLAGRAFVECHFAQHQVWERILELYSELGARPSAVAAAPRHRVMRQARRGQPV